MNRILFPLIIKDKVSADFIKKIYIMTIIIKNSDIIVDMEPNIKNK
jgi:hypothetical protein